MHTNRTSKTKKKTFDQYLCRGFLAITAVRLKFYFFITWSRGCCSEFASCYVLDNERLIYTLQPEVAVFAVVFFPLVWLCYVSRHAWCPKERSVGLSPGMCVGGDVIYGCNLQPRTNTRIYPRFVYQRILCCSRNNNRRVGRWDGVYSRSRDHHNR